MSAPGVTFQLLDGQLLDGQFPDGQLTSGQSPARPPGGGHGGAGDGEYLALRAEARQFRVWRRQPGFALAAARHGDYLVGYACGMPLRPSTSWWRDLTAPVPEDVTAEHPGRTFALADLAVRASWRRQGIATSLCRLLMDDRPEERATAMVPPDAAAAQRAFRNWGWRKVARTRAPAPDAPTLDVLLVPLASQDAPR